MFHDGVSFLLWNVAGLAASLIGPWPTHAPVPVGNVLVNNYTISGIV